MARFHRWPLQIISAAPAGVRDRAAWDKSVVDGEAGLMPDTINWHTDYWGAIIPLGKTGLPLDPMAWQVFINFAKSLGLTEIGDITYFGVVQAWRPGVIPPLTVPPYTGPIENPIPAPLWWSSLRLTQPKTKVYTDHDKVNIYRSANITHPPQVSDVNRTAIEGWRGL